MRATIAILNYNYRNFVALAIESALAQTCADVEVVVVDNGSTDDSLSVIAPYLDRVRLEKVPVNIGQGQGYNRCFEAARGEWIIWLDADDLLDPDCIATCLSLADEQTAKVQFPLRCIDGEGAPLPGVLPFLRHQGDVAPLIRRFGHYAGPPGSGNLYRRSAVAPYFPVDPQDWPICTDTVPFVTAAFHGKVVDSGRPLGSYRLHRKAPSATPGYRGNFITSIAAEVALNYGSRDKSLALLKTRSGIEVATPPLTLPTHVRTRIISWRFAPAGHPFPADTAGSLWKLMHASVAACPGYTAFERLTLRVWALGVLFLPKPLSDRMMSANRSSPVWDAVLRWARGARA